MSEVLDKVVEIVCNQLSVNKEDVTPDASFVEDLGADSLDTVELVMAFEEEFGLEIPDDEAENITTIKSAVDWIEKIVKKSFLLILFFSLIFVSLRLQFALLQKIPVQDANQTFIVERGDSLYGILSNLEEKYDLSSTWWIRFKYMFKESPVIKAGRYNIFPNTTVSELIERFEDGDVQLFKITIIEGTVAKNNLVNLKILLKIKILILRYLKVLETSLQKRL